MSFFDRIFVFLGDLMSGSWYFVRLQSGLQDVEFSIDRRWSEAQDVSDKGVDVHVFERWELGARADVGTCSDEDGLHLRHGVGVEAVAAAIPCVWLILRFIRWRMTSFPSSNRTTAGVGTAG